ncbi:MAG: hypothetical protein JNM07_08445 [Phycisphaerae bacterium]|nr:hypothetical protein [Phycisphaerae bacterium]
MSQFGMAMPGGQLRRTAAMNVYTGLLFVAVVALGVAAGYVWAQGGKVAPAGDPLSFQKAGSIQLKE